MQPGTFVTIEGGEGAGKSTLLAALERLARAAGHAPVTAREPGGTALGERLRAALLRDAGVATDTPAPYAELLVFAAARAELVARVIRPALERGALVLCDRFADSTTAYQQHGRGLPAEAIAAVNAVATDGLHPQLTVLLDLDPALGRQRRDGNSDYIERETTAFHERVRAGYLALAEREPARWLVLDATGPPQLLAERAWARIASGLGGP